MSRGPLGLRPGAPCFNHEILTRADVDLDRAALFIRPRGEIFGGPSFVRTHSRHSYPVFPVCSNSEGFGGSGGKQSFPDEIRLTRDERESAFYLRAEQRTQSNGSGVTEQALRRFFRSQQRRTRARHTQSTCGGSAARN